MDENDASREEGFLTPGTKAKSTGFNGIPHTLFKKKKHQKIISKLLHSVLERVKFGRNLKGVALVREPGRISREAFECNGVGYSAMPRTPNPEARPRTRNRTLTLGIALQHSESHCNTRNRT